MQTSRFFRSNAFYPGRGAISKMSLERRNMCERSCFAFSYSPYLLAEWKLPEQGATNSGEADSEQ